MIISLIGMPATGKSTVASNLSARGALSIIDVDQIIVDKIGMPLQSYIDKFGESKFLEVEESVIFSLQVSPNSVISSGGSACYSSTGMRHLSKQGAIQVYLLTNLETLESRLADQGKSRGIVMNGAVSWKDLLDSRHLLYSELADICVFCDNKTPSEISSEIFQAIKAFSRV